MSPQNSAASHPQTEDAPETSHPASEVTSGPQQSLTTGKSYEPVLLAIEEQLKDSSLQLGQQLPGERALAAAHGISRASVRDAIRVLEAMGVVRTSTGSGPNAGAVVIANPSAGLGNTLRLHMATAHFPVADIIQTRLMMETWAAVEAAPKDHPSAVLLEAARLLDQMELPQTDRDTFHRLDAQFHVLLSSLAGNAVITAMMESLRFAVQHYVSDSIHDSDSWNRIVPELRSQHRAILAAVSERRGDDAANELRHHILWFHAQTSDAIKH